MLFGKLNIKFYWIFISLGKHTWLVNATLHSATLVSQSTVWEQETSATLGMLMITNPALVLYGILV